MKLFIKNNILNMVTIFIVTMFFSCESDIKKVQQLSETSFIPTGEADTLNLKYTDSGKIKSILKRPKMLDYSNITTKEILLRLLQIMLFLTRKQTLLICKEMLS